STCRWRPGSRSTRSRSQRTRPASPVRTRSAGWPPPPARPTRSAGGSGWWRSGRPRKGSSPRSRRRCHGSAKRRPGPARGRSTGGDVAATWLTRVARLLRDEDLDSSPAQVIDAVRLAEALAALRGRAVPGLAEVGEGALAVLCSGEAAPYRLIRERLIVGEEL